MTARSPVHRESSSATPCAVHAAISQGARDYQEDACGHWVSGDRRWLFAVVADGAGGHGGGDAASRAAVAAAEQSWRALPEGGPADPAAFLEDWMAEAHAAVNRAAHSIRRSARSVVVACVTDGRVIHWVHAGDSRLLRFQNGRLVERTRDDSVVQVLFERGQIREEEMGTHPDQSRLLQSLGGEDPPTPRPGRAELASGDSIILCSDGFWEHLQKDDLEELVRTPQHKSQDALGSAVREAVRRGGDRADNTTAILIHCGVRSASAAGRFLYVAAGFLCLFAVLAGFFLWQSDAVKPPAEPSGENTPVAPVPRPVPEPLPIPALEDDAQGREDLPVEPETVEPETVEPDKPEGEEGLPDSEPEISAGSVEILEEPTGQEGDPEQGGEPGRQPLETNQGTQVPEIQQPVIEQQP